MDCKETVFSRSSVRDFSSEAIPPEVLADMLEAARLAPSAQNKQPWRFIVIRNREKIKNLTTNSGFIGLANYFIKNAPCIVIACAETKSNVRLNGQDYYLVDTAIAFQQMMLVAWQHGIGSCWLAAFNENKLKTWLRLPESWRIVGMSPFGYPADKQGLYSKLVKSFAGSKNRLHRDKIFNFID